MTAETTNPPARFSYSSRWTIVPRVIALSTLGGVILLGAVWSAFIGKASGGTLLLIVLGGLTLLAAWMQWRRPQIVLSATGVRDPRVADVLPWSDIAGMRYIDFPRHRQLHIWLRNPEEHAAYVRAWVGTGGTGSEASPLVFGIDRTSGVTVWQQLEKLPAAGEVELIHEKSDVPDLP
ncbi:MAG: hypothetical protein M9965_05735 [Anaerolineae bacterium]|nr:hypothetical protein [Anaerolineae bacterium]